MSLATTLKDIVSRGLDDAASAAASAPRALRRRRRIALVEVAEGRFEARDANGRAPLGTARFRDRRLVADDAPAWMIRLAGADVEIRLAPSRFVIRPLELPEKAQGFLDAVVGGQIDRLTPWTASQAAFGHGPPTRIPGDRVRVEIAAISRDRVAPYVEALHAFKPESITVSVAPNAADAPLSVFSRRANASRRVRRARSALIVGLGVAGSAAAVCFCLWTGLGAHISAATDEADARLSALRARIARAESGDDLSAALAEKKRRSPTSLIVLEQLSRALPDDTFLTRMKVGDGKLMIAGETREAASLINTLEQTGMFRRATFSAPTTQSAGGGHENFQIESEIVPTLVVTR